ncbi:hypothetical protein M405DRAFT_870161 [Rhizopogon salebrosus TDB-379]|nr:hypothetical protein M405DRAFT_870161 [Rhizopogon salebrosus TDB-379]
MATLLGEISEKSGHRPRFARQRKERLASLGRKSASPGGPHLSSDHTPDQFRHAFASCWRTSWHGW